MRIAGGSVLGEGAPLESTFPVTGEVLHRFDGASLDQVDEAVGAARQAFDRGVWSDRTPEERATVLEGSADLLMARRDDLVQRVVFDNGKTLAEAEIDVMACVGACRREAEHARQAVPRRMSDQRGVERWVSQEPVGVVAALTPYNAPLMFAGVKSAPALAAGNSVVLKPSERSPLVVSAFVDCLAEAGLPPGVLNLVHGRVDVAAHLSSHPGVDMVTLTGGNAAGRAVMGAAAPTVKKLLLELGGKSAHIVLGDADLEAAIPAVAAGVFRNAGQRCFSGTRLLVEESVADEVIEGVVEIARGLRLGDPFEETTQVGPLIDGAAVEAAEAFVERSRGEARVLCGGRRREDLAPGAFFPPTVLADCDPRSYPAQEELFGPVLTVLRVRGAQHAVEVANATPYGLAGGVWSRDEDKARRVAGRLRAGYVWVNTYAAVFGDVPFGGFGQSGIGREAGIWGYDAYTEWKTLMVDSAGGASAPLFR